MKLAALQCKTKVFSYFAPKEGVSNCKCCTTEITKEKGAKDETGTQLFMALTPPTSVDKEGECVLESTNKAPVSVSTLGNDADTKDKCVKACSADTCVAYEWGPLSVGNKCTTFTKPTESKLIVKVQEAKHDCFIKKKAATQESSAATFNTATKGKCALSANPVSSLKSSQTAETIEAC